MVLKPSSIVLILANLIPIAGVLWLDWDALEILLLYWTESVVIGVINVMRMLASRSRHPLSGLSLGPKGNASSALFDAAGSRLPSGGIKAFIIPFFILHYGAFCYGHLSVVTGIFSPDQPRENILSLPMFAERSFWIAVAAITVSHLVSFFNNYIGKEEYLRTGVGALMQRPYGRIIVMHISIIIGAGFINWLGNPLPMLVVLVVVKTIIDLRFHHAERDKFSVVG